MKVHLLRQGDRWPACGTILHVSTVGDPSMVTCGHCLKRIADDETDRLYLHLKGALERLNLASGMVPAHWQADVQAAWQIVANLGSSLCPEQWSQHDQPEYAQEHRA